MRLHVIVCALYYGLLQVIGYPVWLLGEACCRVLTWLKHRAGCEGAVRVAWKASDESGEQA